MKRTTLLLDDQLMILVRKLAEKEGRTLTAQIHILLREGMRSLKTQPKKRYSFNPPVEKGGTQPGVDISDSKSLYDLMDGIS